MYLTEFSFYAFIVFHVCNNFTQQLRFIAVSSGYYIVGFLENLLKNSQWNFCIILFLYI